MLSRYCERVRQNPGMAGAVENSVTLATYLYNPQENWLLFTEGGYTLVGLVKLVHRLIFQDAAQREANNGQPVPHTTDEIVGAALLGLREVHLLTELLIRHFWANARRKAWRLVLILQLVKSLCYLYLQRTYLRRVGRAAVRRIAWWKKPAEDTPADIGDSGKDDEWIPRVSLCTRDIDELGSSLWDFAAFLLNLFYFLRPTLLAWAAAEHEASGREPPRQQRPSPQELHEAVVSSVRLESSTPSAVSHVQWGFWVKWFGAEVAALVASVVVARRQPALIHRNVEGPQEEAQFGYPVERDVSHISQNALVARTATLLFNFIREPFFSANIRPILTGETGFIGFAKRIPILGIFVRHFADYYVGLQSESYLSTVGPPP